MKLLLTVLIFSFPVRLLCQLEQPFSGSTVEQDQTFVQSLISSLQRNRYTLPRFQWVLIDNHELNSSADAQQMRIYVYRPMVHFLRDDPGELAFVIAHEIGHLVDRSCEVQKNQPGVGLAGLLSGQATLSAQSICEQRADEIGLKILAGAGGNPYDAAAFFGRLQMYSGDTGLTGFFLRLTSDHPIDTARIANLRRAFQQFCSNGTIVCTSP